MKPTSTEIQAKTLLDQCKDQKGKFTSLHKAQLSYYRRMYYYFRNLSINLFGTNEETIRTENKELKQRNKDLNDSVIMLNNQKKHLQETCILLQHELAEARLQMKHKVRLTKTHGAILTPGHSCNGTRQERQVS